MFNSNRDAIKARHKSLCILIERYNKSYYDDNVSLVCDEEYDSLYTELVRLEAEHGSLLNINNSPTQYLGYSNAKGSIKHVIPLLSLRRDTEKGIMKFLSASMDEVIVEPKMDGIALSMHYKAGQLRYIATRGNGIIGEDVTHNRCLISNIPDQLSVEALTVECDVVLHGELVVTNDDFIKFPSFVSPRHLAASSIRVKHRDKNIYCNTLKFYVYRCVSLSGSPNRYTSEICMAKSLGFSTMPQLAVKDNTLDLQLLCTDIKADSQVMLDGIVLKYNNTQQRLNSGSTLKYDKWLVAYKFPSPLFTSTIKQIDFQIGRSGVVTPIAVIDTIKISGRSISKVTLHNMGYVLSHNISPGDLVTLRLTGEAVPALVSTTDMSTPACVPMHCMSCNTQLLWNSTKTQLLCPNTQHCHDIKVAAMKHFASRNAFNIKGLSGKTIDLLITHHLVARLVDIFKLTAEDLAGLDGFKDKKIANLLSAIKDSSSITKARLIYSLGIEHVGLGAAHKLADYMDQLDKAPVGPVVKNAVQTFLSQKYNVELWNELLSMISIKQ